MQTKLLAALNSECFTCCFRETFLTEALKKMNLEHVISPTFLLQSQSILSDMLRGRRINRDMKVFSSLFCYLYSLSSLALFATFIERDVVTFNLVVVSPSIAADVKHGN